MVYTRKTTDEYEIQQYTGHQHGWECVTAEATYREAKATRQCYRENQPAYPVRIIKKRVKLVRIA